MTNTTIKKDPKWFVILMKIICVITYTPILIGQIWLLYIYISGESQKILTDSPSAMKDGLMFNPWFIIPIAFISMIVLCYDLYKKLTYTQK